MVARSVVSTLLAVKGMAQGRCEPTWTISWAMN